MIVDDLFYEDGTNKTVIITINGQTVPEDKILFESLKFTESICSQNEFKFGLAEQSVVEFQIADYPNITGQKLSINFMIDGYDFPIYLGEYVITEAQRDTSNANIRKVIAMSDFSAPDNEINIFSNVSNYLEDFETYNYLIAPEMLALGSVNNRYSAAFDFATLLQVNQTGPGTQWIDSSDVIHNFSIKCDAWSIPRIDSESYALSYLMFYLDHPENYDYLSDSVLNKVNRTIDEVIAASGLNPPADFSIKVKGLMYKYLEKLKSFFQMESRTNIYIM